MSLTIAPDKPNILHRVGVGMLGIYGVCEAWGVITATSGEGVADEGRSRICE